MRTPLSALALACLLAAPAVAHEQPGSPEEIGREAGERVGRRVPLSRRDRRAPPAQARHGRRGSRRGLGFRGAGDGLAGRAERTRDREHAGAGHGRLHRTARAVRRPQELFRRPRPARRHRTRARVGRCGRRRQRVQRVHAAGRDAAVDRRVAQAGRRAAHRRSARARAWGTRRSASTRTTSSSSRPPPASSAKPKAPSSRANTPFASASHKHTPCAQSFLAVLLSLAAATAVHARRTETVEETWPGFRGHEMSGVAATAKLPDRWSPTEHVKWAVPIAGHGWSSPIVWGDTVFVTSAISSKPFKKPTPGPLRQRVHRRDVGAGPVGRGDHEARPGARQRADRRGGRDPLHGLRARREDREDQVGARSGEDEAVRRPPSQEHLRVGNAGDRRRAALRVVRTERRPVRLFARRQAAVEEAVGPEGDLPRLRHRVVADRLPGARLPAAGQRGAAVHRRARREDRRRDLAHAAIGDRLSAQVVVDDAVRLEERRRAPRSSRPATAR